MGFLLLFGMLGLSFAFGGLGSDNSDDTPPDDTPEEPEPPITSDLTAFLLADGEEVTGTDGADLFTLPPDAEGFLETTIRGGGGDDLVYLDTGSESVPLADSGIYGEDGDDAIRAAGQDVTISGGNGDDTIEGWFWGGDVSGDAGDDHITAVGGASDATIVNGGLGNDTIDGRGSDNARFRGDEGDDLIISDGYVYDGTGYALVSNGGDGDDTLVHEIPMFPPNFLGPDDTSPAILIGGDGADSFEVRLVSGGGSFFDTPTDPEVVYTEGVSISDYEQGTDVITIDLSELSSSFDVTSASLSENATGEATTLVILVEARSDALPDQEVVITIGATGLTWDDINFVGDDTSTITLIEPIVPVIGGTTTGTAGDDVFQVAQGTTGAIDDTAIQAGDGDDTLDLSPLGTSPYFGPEFYFHNSTISGGGGDDEISLTSPYNSMITGDAGNNLLDVTDAQGSTISGGDGNDTIQGDVLGASVFGDAGNDEISIAGGPSDMSTIDGGAGDDIIDGRDGRNYSLLGGEGDDLLFSDGYADGDAGYVALSDGGDGDDTLVHTYTRDFVQGSYPSLTGGEGADSFVIRMSDTYDNPFSSSSTAQVIVIYDELAEITDFELGTDVITVELLDPADPNAVPHEFSLEEDTAAGTTTLTVLMQHDGTPDHGLKILIHAIGLTMDDINIFYGDALAVA